MQRRTIVAAFAGSAVVGVAGCTSPPVTAGDASQRGTGADPTTGAPAQERSATTTPASTATPSVLAVNGPDISRAADSTRAVALTFHGAGDVAIATKVLDLVAQARAAVTIFAVGQWLTANLDLGRRIVAQGHDLGNHTWSHQAMTALSQAELAKEVRGGADAVAASVGSPGLLFRPSGTQHSTPAIRAAAEAAGYHRCISYDVDPEDYADPGRDVVVQRTLAGMSAGSIVSLHLGHPGTLEALPAILDGIAARGFRAVRVTDLLTGA